MVLLAAANLMASFVNDTSKLAVNVGQFVSYALIRRLDGDFSLDADAHYSYHYKLARFLISLTGDRGEHIGNNRTFRYQKLNSMFMKELSPFGGGGSFCSSLIDVRR